jgi:hypothetical protein
LYDWRLPHLSPQILTKFKPKIPSAATVDLIPGNRLECTLAGAYNWLCHLNLPSNPGLYTGGWEPFFTAALAFLTSGSASFGKQDPAAGWHPQFKSLVAETSNTSSIKGAISECLEFMVNGQKLL